MRPLPLAQREIHLPGVAQFQLPRLLEHLHGLGDPAQPSVHHPQIMVGRSVTRVFLGRPTVRVLGAGQVSLFEVQVPQAKQNLGLGLAVAKRIKKKGDSFLVTAGPTRCLGLGKGRLHNLAPPGHGQARGVGQRSEIRSFTV